MSRYESFAEMKLRFEEVLVNKDYTNFRELDVEFRELTTEFSKKQRLYNKFEWTELKDQDLHSPEYLTNRLRRMISCLDLLLAEKKRRYLK